MYTNNKNILAYLIFILQAPTKINFNEDIHLSAYHHTIISIAHIVSMPSWLIICDFKNMWIELKQWSYTI